MGAERGVRGAGRGGGGDDFLLKVAGGGVSWAGGGGGARGWEGACGELGGGGVNIFFRGRNSHQVKNKHIGTVIHDPKVRTSTNLKDFQKLLSENIGG